MFGDMGSNDSSTDVSSSGSGTYDDKYADDAMMFNIGSFQAWREERNDTTSTKFFSASTKFYSLDNCPENSGDAVVVVVPELEMISPECEEPSVELEPAAEKKTPSLSSTIEEIDILSGTQSTTGTNPESWSLEESDTVYPAPAEAKEVAELVYREPAPAEAKEVAELVYREPAPAEAKTEIAEESPFFVKAFDRRRFESQYEKAKTRWSKGSRRVYQDPCYYQSRDESVWCQFREDS